MIQVQEIRNKPSAHRGIAIISYWNKRIEQTRILRNTQNARRIFNHVFGENGKEIYTKYSIKKDFCGMFLNLDTGYQLALLQYLRGGDKNIKLELPEIPDWQNLGKQYGMDQLEDFTQEDVRMVCADQIDKWDIYPHDLHWFTQFVLYACNTPIVDEFYGGEKFGNYANWVKYWEFLNVFERLDLCIVMKNY